MHLYTSLVLLSIMLPVAVYGAPTGAHDASTTNTHSKEAAGGHAEVRKCDSHKSDNKDYIISLKPGVSPATVRALIPKGIEVFPVKIINGFYGAFDAETLKKIGASPDVKSITQDCDHDFTGMVTQTDAPWGLARLTSTTKITGSVEATTHSFTYDESAGSCADIVVVDSGVYIEHSDFGGRARWGATFGRYGKANKNAKVDDLGHGTQCAGIAAGTKYGVAKGAHVIAVKVGDSTGVKTTNILGGLEWILDNKSATRPTVVSYSISKTNEPLVDEAAEKLVEAGIHFIAAAGNKNHDVATVSPARVPSIITVGATDINDHKASYSNFGTAVDVFAPGTDIRTPFIGSKKAVHIDSGTSLAAPYVSGMVAYMLCREPGKTISPATMQQMIKANALKGVITGLPAGTPNELAHIPTPAAGQANSEPAQKAPAAEKGHPAPAQPHPAGLRPHSPTQQQGH